MAETRVIAVHTYGSQRVKEPTANGRVSTYKIGYTSAACDVLLNVAADELALAEAVTRRTYRAAVFLWRDNQWLELPTSRNADYLEPTARSGPGFNTSGYRPVSPSSGEKETTVKGIRAERVQRSPNEKHWYWLYGDTDPHCDLLKRQGARFSGKRRA